MRRALAAAAAVAALAPAALAAQSYQTTTQARRLEGTGPLTVQVDYAAGRFRFTPGEAQQLYRVALTYDEDLFDPTIEYQADQRLLAVDVSGRSHVEHGNFDKTRQRLDLSVSPDVPVDLELKFAAAQAEIELGGLSLRSARLETGASQTTVSFSAPNKVACSDLAFSVGAAQFEADQLGNSRCGRISVDGGVGDLTLDLTGDWAAGRDGYVKLNFGFGKVQLRIPRGLGVQLKVDRLLASVDRAGFVKRGSAYYTANYDAAPAKITLDVQAVLGDIDVTWVR